MNHIVIPPRHDYLFGLNYVIAARISRALELVPGEPMVWQGYCSAAAPAYFFWHNGNWADTATASALLLELEP